MKITELHIKNFKSIHHLHITDIPSALILVGQNNSGKTTILDAVRAVGGDYLISSYDFQEDGSNIEITVSLFFSEEDLKLLHRKGIVSSYRRWDAWFADF